MKLPSILLYHQIEHKNNSKEKDRTCISISEFHSQIISLKKSGWKFLALNELLEILTNDSSKNHKKNVLALTFDDGYTDLMDISDFLYENKIPATVFICPDYIGKNNLWNPKSYKLKKHLSLPEMKELIGKGFSFEFHGKNHHRLTKFNKAQLLQEIRTGIENFEKALGLKPRIISYPYGSYNNDVINIAKDFFDFGLSVTQGRWYGKANKYNLNRFEITNWMTADFIAEILELPVKNRPGFYRNFKMHKLQKKNADK